MASNYKHVAKFKMLITQSMISHISTSDESLLGNAPNPSQKQVMTCKNPPTNGMRKVPSSPPMTTGKWYVLETEEMQICKRKDWISWNDHQSQLSIHGPSKTSWNSELANYDSKTSLVIPWIWKLLLTIHQEICTPSTTPE